MRLTPVLCVASMLLAACGGGGGGASQTPPSSAPPGSTSTPPAQTQSIGGIWHLFTTVPAGAATMFIAEDGNMRIMDTGLAFGAGAAIVNGVDELSGSYQARGIQPTPASPPAQTRSCTFEGKVVERVSMQLAIHCTDTAGAATDQNATFLYDASYASPSSLEAISGNYTLPFAAQTNSLTIAKDGSIFGVYHNGQQCTVNGRVAIIDARFNLYRFELLFSSCQVFQQYEGQTLTGLAARSLPGTTANSLLVLITGVINGRMEFVSVSYEPV